MNGSSVELSDETVDAAIHALRGESIPPGFMIDWCDRAIYRAGAARAPAVDVVPVAWRWRCRDGTIWIYDPDPDWLDEQGDAVEKEPLYAAAPGQPVDARDADYYKWRLQEIIPLFGEARDALTAIPLASAKLRGIDLTLGDRMDRAGTRTRADFDAAIAHQGGSRA